METTDKFIDRTYNFEIRAEQDDAHGTYLTGRPIVYGEKTDLGYFDEVIERGALDKTDLRDVAFVVNHNIDMVPLARSRRNNANSTMQMTIDENGMLIRVDLDTEHNPQAAELYSAVQRKDIDGMSFRFRADGESWDDLDSEHPTRHITSIASVREVSAVTYPAYEGASLEAERSRGAVETARDTVETARRVRKAQKDKVTALALKLKLADL